MPKAVRPVRVVGDVAYVALTQGKEAVIDADMADLVGRYNWYAENPYRDLWYAARKSSADGKHFLHRMIMGSPLDQEIDHKDGDGLNCLRSNLRLATHQEQMRNRRGKERDLPKGVQVFGGGFVAKIGLDGKQFQVGSLYASPEEASEVYELFAAHLFREFHRAESKPVAEFIPNKERARRIVGYDWRGDPIYGSDQAPLQKGVKREKSK